MTSEDWNCLAASSVHNINIAHGLTDVKPLFLKTYPSLNAYCLKHKLVKELFVYYVIRTLNINGSGLVYFKNALQYLQTELDLPESTAYRYLKSGDKIFYTIVKTRDNKKIIRYLSLSKIADKFNLDNMHRPIFVEVGDCKSLKQIRSWLYSSIFKTTDYNKIVHPLSHQAIKELTGVSVNAQQTYNKILPLKITPNFATHFTLYHSKSDQYWIPTRLGNSYTIEATVGNSGMTKRINRSLKHKSNQSLREKATGTKVQRYFDDSKSFLKCTTHDERTLMHFKNTRDFNLWQRA